MTKLLKALLIPIEEERETKKRNKRKEKVQKSVWGVKLKKTLKNTEKKNGDTSTEFLETGHGPLLLRLYSGSIKALLRLY